MALGVIVMVIIYFRKKFKVHMNFRKVRRFNKPATPYSIRVVEVLTAHMWWF